MSSFTRVGRWGGPDADTGVDILTAIDAERSSSGKPLGVGGQAPAKNSSALPSGSVKLSALP